MQLEVPEGSGLQKGLVFLSDQNKGYYYNQSK